MERNRNIDSTIAVGKPNEVDAPAARERTDDSETERLFDLRRQYESQTALLRKTGMIETSIEADASGIEREVSRMTGIDGKTYPVPSYETLVARIAERKELLGPKADQGFMKLVLVPFGMGLDAMILKFRAYLLEYKKAHPEFARLDPTKQDDSDKTDWNPLWVWEDTYKGTDADGTLVYDPISFNASHGGATKADILQRQGENEDATAGWRILLLQAGENDKGIKNTPRKGRGRSEGTKNPRQNVETGKSASEYLEIQLQGSQDEGSSYRGESGMTPEEWIVASMVNLEETGKPMDLYDAVDDTVDSAMVSLTGAYFSDSNLVPSVHWGRRFGQQAKLHAYNPTAKGALGGVRFTVRA